MSTDNKFHFSIDRGGTFCDVYARLPAGHNPPYVVLKLLSVDPSYPDAPREGIRRVLDQYSGESCPRDQPVSSKHIGSIRMGTTVATNALLERKGERVCFVVTRGFKDVLQIGNQSRPEIFALEVRKPELLYETVVEIDERVRVLPAVKTGTNQSPPGEDQIEPTDEIVTGLTGERCVIMKKPHREEIRESLQKAYDLGIRSLAVTLIHSYTFSDHELLVAEIAREIGFTHISLSSQIMPMVKLVPRSFTANADAYLSPCIHAYLQQFIAGFDSHILTNARVTFMQSDGGLAEMNNFNGFRAVLSGPAGGVIGYSRTTPRKGASEINQMIGIADDEPWLEEAVIALDIGGTSSDVSRFAGEYEHIFENTTAGVVIQAPQLDISTVAAGGGSRLFFKQGVFVVGPESAGADPGPACYRRQGPLTVTDANLLLGRLIPDQFPHIFGHDRNEPLDVQATKNAFATMTREINEYLTSQTKQSAMTEHEVALGFVSVANEAMCRPIRGLTQSRGYDITKHTLACFGGAAGQHATSVARSLGIRSIFIHRFSGILSAFGIGLADVVFDLQEPASTELSDSSIQQLQSRIESLNSQAVLQLKAQGFDDSTIKCTTFLNLRYQGTDTAMMTHNENNSYENAFKQRYEQEFGFSLERPIVIDDIRVRAVGMSPQQSALEIPSRHEPLRPHSVTKTYFSQGWLDTQVYLISDLRAEDIIDGPALIIDNTATILIEPGCHARLLKSGDLVIIVGSEHGEPTVTTELDAIQLSIFSHRFMSIAEQMGRTLQRTSISTNIKERLDFSAALFDSQGGLVANAPHLPVHLGAMQEAVKAQVRLLGDDWHEGDVVLSNHPTMGGSHLPDITVITPVFEKGKKVFFVACRGHHGDIGGISPGSMPAWSKLLSEEGASFKSFKIVTKGRFDEEGVTKILTTPSGPGCEGTRNLSDNISDLKAQVAANNRGIHLMSDLIKQYSLDVVQAYMHHIQANAEAAVREMLIDLCDRLEHSKQEKLTLSAVDQMDDGSLIKLAVTIDRRDGSAIFDFSGSSCEVYGNTNAPPAVTYSAVIYCLRCLVKSDIPLNQGCLNPVQIIIPENSILKPSPEAAVVGGNVLTSQRVTDVVLRAFQACAASQGCMNNLSLGDGSFGYYETIAGGCGAGPTFHGQSGVHSHMTNTRITDPEIFERRYPVLVRQFSLRPNSGGHGKFKGGDGVIRDLEFLRDGLTIGILSERRSIQPWGLAGGGDAERGLNLLITRAGRSINLGGKNTYHALRGDRIVIHTPGGGGYGKHEPESESGGASTSLIKNLASLLHLKKSGGSIHAYQHTQETA